ncbi:hypothetical protein SCALM49S_06214 [Streptomyces californicus]
MDSDTTATVDATEGGRGDVDAGAYEVLRRRLSAQAGELIRRAEALNARRTRGRLDRPEAARHRAGPHRARRRAARPRRHPRPGSWTSTASRLAALSDAELARLVRESAAEA